MVRYCPASTLYSYRINYHVVNNVKMSWQIYRFTVVHGVKVRAFLSVRHAALAHEQTVGVVPAVLGALDTELSA